VRPNLDKPRPGEVVVEREGIANASSLHDLEACGVDEGVEGVVVLVAPAQLAPRGLVHGWFNLDDGDPR
jgi:hypothetical protein